MTDPVKDLAHDHAALNKLVLGLGARLAQLVEHEISTGELADDLSSLREELFHHFAREEEGLFPFVTETFPDYAAQVEAMATAHDNICGALARACHLAADDSEPVIVSSIFSRFETAYASHARIEAELFEELASKLTDEQRDKLAALVRDS